MNHQQADQLAAQSLTEEFLEVEQFYQKQISSKVNQLASMSDYDQSVEDDLAQLDTSIQELKEEIAEAPKGSEAEIINTMIHNYKTKVELLERILSRKLDDSETNFNKSKKDEKINI